MAYTKQYFEDGEVLKAEQLNAMDAAIEANDSAITQNRRAIEQNTQALNAQPDWSKQEQKPTYTATEVGAHPDTWMPTPEQVGADPTGTATAAVSSHNTNKDSHPDLRNEVSQIKQQLTEFLDIDEETLDQLSELIAAIVDNRTDITELTSGKVNKTDIINNLVTNDSTKVLAAAQGVELKRLIDAIKVITKLSEMQDDSSHRTVTDAQIAEWDAKLNVSELGDAVDDALAQAKEGGEFDGADGERGTGILKITTAPSSYTTATGGFTPTYRVALSTVKTQAKVDKVLVGDTVAYNYYQYPVGYVDASYVYLGARTSVRGATGGAGKTAYAYAQDGGYTGTEAEFAEKLAETAVSVESQTLTDAQKAQARANIGADGAFDPTAYRLPILYLTGDTTGMTKENAVTLSYVYGENSGSCTLKWQGSSSLAWDKKNYTIKFGTAFEVVDGWGAQSKYCLKANWIDHSHSRNVVSAKLWGLIRKNRNTTPSNLKNLPNAGAIDGFPAIVMLNGKFHGLYSFNIPKDAWMFGMGSGTKEAIVTADNQADDTAFKAETLLDADGLELEYSSSGFSATAVKDSFNTLINACINSWGGDLDTEVAKYLDWESAIDYYIFCVIIKGGDMVQKNAIYATFDGVKWYFSAYDMDTTYGLAFDGSALDRAVSNVSFVEVADSHRVFELIKRFKTNELKARYNELRANALSETRICQYFENYAWDISSSILLEDVKKWTSVRGSAVNGIDQICRWVRQRLEATDAWLAELPAQETPVEPEEPVEVVNLVPTSTDTDGSIYNGTGYKEDVRLSSSGGVSSSAQSGTVTTGFMPWQSKGVIQVKGATFPIDAGRHNYVNFYNADKSFMYGTEIDDNLKGTATGALATIKCSYDAETGITTIDCSECTGGTTIGDAAVNGKYFRICPDGKGADLIVTVNQEIV